MFRTKEDDVQDGERKRDLVHECEAIWSFSSNGIKCGCIDRLADECDCRRDGRRIVVWQGGHAAKKQSLGMRNEKRSARWC